MFNAVFILYFQNGTSSQDVVKPRPQRVVSEKISADKENKNVASPADECKK